MLKDVEFYKMLDRANKLKDYVLQREINYVTAAIFIHHNRSVKYKKTSDKYKKLIAFTTRYSSLKISENEKFEFFFIFIATYKRQWKHSSLK